MAMKPLDFTPITTNNRSMIVRAKEKEQAVGLCLAVYCGETRNGGVIKDCKKWTKNDWLVSCGVKSKPQDCELYHWQGNDLHVVIYSLEAEEKANARSAAGRKANETRWHGATAKLPREVRKKAAIFESATADTDNNTSGDYASPEDFKAIK